VPCVLVSAWTAPGRVVRPEDGPFFDHTSVISTLCRRWPELGLPLTERPAAAATIWPALDLPQPRADDAEVPAAIEAILAGLPTAGAPIRSTRRPAGASGRLRAMSIALKAPLRRCPARAPASGVRATNRDAPVNGDPQCTRGAARAASTFDLQAATDPLERARGGTTVCGCGVAGPNGTNTVQCLV
jgi:hypothetical protein